MIIKTSSSQINLSLCGCGFLGVYHIGVVAAFKEHRPEILDTKMAGCSAGSLVAACAMCGCCLGQMCSDALEIAMRARSRALGPLHPTFNIVDIIRNGLRKILPSNAHELCSGRLYISLTRWKDNKNVIINQFYTREELIQVLICSSFVPYWSGIVPPKLHDEYYWDGTLTNNNPIIDENTILVSPFAGESDICPRDESGSFYSVDIQGTDILCTPENLYRLTHALFPPKLSVLKEICWRGYIDGLSFLQTRNMIKSSCSSTKTNISSVLGCNYIGSSDEDEKQLKDSEVLNDSNQMFERIEVEYSFEELDEEFEKNTKIKVSSFSEKFTRKKDLPTPVFAVFADAVQKVEDPLRCYFTQSIFYTVWLLLTLPITLPIELACAFIRRLFSRFVPSFLLNLSSNRLINLFWSFFCENEDNYCYHVKDCECIETRISSDYKRFYQPDLRTYRRQISAPASACSSTSDEFNLLNIEEDFSAVINSNL